MNKPPRNHRMVCPVCSGAGKIAEDTSQFEFITRDPITQICLICNGKGYVGYRKKLPDGTEAHLIASGMLVPGGQGLPASRRQCQSGVTPVKEPRTAGMPVSDRQGLPASRRQCQSDVPPVKEPHTAGMSAPVQAVHTLADSPSGIIGSAGFTVVIIHGILNHQELSSVIKSALQPPTKE